MSLNVTVCGQRAIYERFRSGFSLCSGQRRMKSRQDAKCLPACLPASLSLQLRAGDECLPNGHKRIPRRMVSSGMLRSVALVRTDVSQELSTSFIRVTRISELGTTLALTSNRHTLRSQKTAFFRVTVVKTSNLTNS
jgi:hypothetical protein